MNTDDIELDSGRSLTLRVAPAGCSHLDQIREVLPTSAACEECLRIGDDWVHLRECLYCGNVACCDTSKSRHATKHHHDTGHAVIQSLETGEDWMYCYPDDVFMEVVE
jgi:uncharacterized UBP type Zn finger protein